MIVWRAGDQVSLFWRLSTCWGSTYQTACQVGGGAVSELYLDSCKTQSRGLWRRYSKKWFNILRSPSDLFILQHFNAYQLHTHIFTLQSIISFPFISNVSFQAGQTMSWAQILLQSLLTIHIITLSLYLWLWFSFVSSLTEYEHWHEQVHLCHALLFPVHIIWSYSRILLSGSMVSPIW